MKPEVWQHKKSGKLFEVRIEEEIEGANTYELTGLTGPDQGKKKVIAEKTLKKSYKKLETEELPIGADSSNAQPQQESLQEATAVPKPSDTEPTYWQHNGSGALFVLLAGGTPALPLQECTQITKAAFNKIAKEKEDEIYERNKEIVKMGVTDTEIVAESNVPTKENKGLYGMDFTKTKYLDDIKGLPPVGQEQPKEEPQPAVIDPNDPNRYFYHEPSNGYWYASKAEIASNSLRYANSIETCKEITKAEWDEYDKRTKEEWKERQKAETARRKEETQKEIAQKIVHDEMCYFYLAEADTYWSEYASNINWDNDMAVGLSTPITKEQFETGRLHDDIPLDMIEKDGTIKTAAFSGNATPSVFETPEQFPAIATALGILHQEEAKEEPQERGGSMRENRAEREHDAKPFNPKHPYLRQSMIKTYELDPGTFYAQYEQGHNESTIFTSTGTAVHGVMEDFFTLVKNGLVHPDPTHQGEALIEWHDRPYNVRQFTQECLTEWWSKYGWADEEWFSKFLGYTERYLRRVITEGLPNVIGVEFEFKLEEDKLGTPVSGTIDRIDRLDDRTIRIVDYKTNFQAFSGYEMENSSQFKMYTLALQQLKDQIGDFDIVVCQYEMIRLGIKQAVTFDQNELEAFRVYIRMLWDKMLSGSDRDFRPSKYSAFSSLRTGNPAYDDMIHNRIVSNYDAENVEALIEELEIVEATFKTAKVRKEELQIALKSHIAQADGELQVGDNIYSVRNGNATYNFDSQQVINNLALTGNASLIPEVVSFSAKQLRENLPAPLYQQLEAGASISYAKPSITKRKVKKPATKKEGK